MAQLGKTASPTHFLPGTESVWRTALSQILIASLQEIVALELAATNTLVRTTPSAEYTSHLNLPKPDSNELTQRVHLADIEDEPHQTHTFETDKVTVTSRAAKRVAQSYSASQ